LPPKKNLKLSAVWLPACAEASVGRRRLSEFSRGEFSGKMRSDQFKNTASNRILRNAYGVSLKEVSLKVQNIPPKNRQFIAVFSGFDLSTSQSWVFVLSFNKASGKFYYCSGLKKIRERG